MTVRDDMHAYLCGRHADDKLSSLNSALEFLCLRLEYLEQRFAEHSYVMAVGKIMELSTLRERDLDKISKHNASDPE